MPILPLLTGLLRVDSARLPFLVDLAMPVMLMVPSFLARHLYAAAFELRCRRARELHLDAEQTRYFLSAAGGVSPLGGVLGLIFWLPILFAVLRGLFAPLIRHLLP